MDISSMLNSMLPTLSYIINLFDRVFTIFCSYFGIDVTTPTEQETTDAPDTAV